MDNTPAYSPLFPDADVETVNAALDLAAQLSTDKVTFTPEDILVATAMSRFVADALKGAKGRATASVRALAGERPEVVRALANLGHTLQLIRQDNKTTRVERPITLDAAGLAQALIPLVAICAPDKKRLGARPPR